jgi:hypothetical protein
MGTIEEAWDEYRPWAKRSRTLQRTLNRWNLAAAGAAILAAVLGAAAVGSKLELSSLLSGLATVAALVAPLLGHHLLEYRSEAQWIQARASAEAIRSACFLFATGVAPYDGPDSQGRFIAFHQGLALEAAGVGLTPSPDPVGTGQDARRRSFPMDALWYLTHRLDKQRAYYRRRQTDHEDAIKMLRRVGLLLSFLGAALATLAASYPGYGLAPWIGVMTTLGGFLVAYGAMERRQFLAASYAAMATALGHVRERHKGGQRKLEHWLMRPNHY